MTKSKQKSILLTGAMFLSLCVLGTLSPVNAANIDVNSLASGPGGKFNVCTLQDAILAHETNTPVNGCTAGEVSGDVITLTIPGTYKQNARMVISKGNLTIQGATTDPKAYVLNGEGMHSFFDINADNLVTIKNMTLTNGHDNTNSGAIFSRSKLAIENAIISNNTSQNAEGAISIKYISGQSLSSGNLSMKNVDIYGNKSVTHESSVSISNSKNATIDNVSIHDNQSSTGISVKNSTNVVFTNVTVSKNNDNVTNKSILGAILVQSSAVSLINSTISDNTNSGLLTKSDSALPESELTIKNTILANNGKNCSFEFSEKVNFTSLGYNISSDNTCTGFSDSTDKNSITETFLAPLAYGTNSIIPTNALLKGSPAIDGGDNNGCPATDARGEARPYGLKCDIGAYELRTKTPAVALFRFFNIRNGEHFFTIDPVEANFIRTDPGMIAQWNFEGIAYPVDEDTNGSNVAVHRFVQKSNGYHHFTKDTYEVSVLQGMSDFVYEGVKFYAQPNELPGTSPVYRFFNRINGAHLFTINPIEADFLRTSQYGKDNWNDELIEYHVFRN